MACAPCGTISPRIARSDYGSGRRLDHVRKLNRASQFKSGIRRGREKDAQSEEEITWREIRKGEMNLSRAVDQEMHHREGNVEGRSES